MEAYNRSEMGLTWRAKVVLVALAILPRLLGGCASNKSGGATGSDIIPPEISTMN